MPGPDDEVPGPSGAEANIATNTPAPIIILKISAKKDSTEAMVKSLISRTHALKPTSYTLKPNETNTDCFLRYPNKEAAEEVLTKISGEKVNGAAFVSEIIEVDKPSDSDGSSEGEQDPTPSKTQKSQMAAVGLLSKDISAEAVRTISEMLKQNPKRKQVSLNISPRNRLKRHKRMKTGSKHMRKQKKHSTSSDSESAPAFDNLDIDDNLVKKVKSILAKEPIAAASTSSGIKGKSFDPYTGLPGKPSKVNKERTRNLMKSIHISSSDEDNHGGSDKVAALLKILMKTQSGKQKKHLKKKKKKRKTYSTESESSDSSSSSSSDTSTSSSSSSDESPSKLRKKLKKLQKKGKLKSGRHRKGLAVIRNEIWPHDGINARLAGKTFQTVESLTQMAFVGGILNPLLDSEDFKRLEKKKLVPKLRQKLRVLNELMHGIIRTQNFPEVRDFYLSTLEQLETGQGSWKDEEYWNTQMLLFRTVLRSAPHQPPPLRRRSTDLSSGLQPRDCCHQFNNDGCTKESPHPNNDPNRSPETVHHFCKICLRRNLKKVHAAKACKSGSSK